jgi:AcrR family transcriptional regulator
VSGAPVVPPDRSPPPDAPTRILHATARLLAERGVARFNLQEVAEAAAVSKGLIHYHYHDRDTLLTRLVEALGADIARRQQAMIAAATPETAVDDVWTWLAGELRRGHLRVLQELTQEPGALVRGAVNAAAAHRRATTAATLERLFALLGLRPRVPPPLLADVVVAFEDGLVLASVVQPEQDPRVPFDVFWLAVLGMAE